MRKFRVLAWVCLLVLLTSTAHAQYTEATTGSITTSSADCTTAAACVSLQLRSTDGSLSLKISGTYSATLQFESSVDGTTWAGISGDPLPSGSRASSTTSTGTWVFNVAGLGHFRVRASAYTSGTASIALRPSSAAARVTSLENLSVLNNIRYCDQFAGADAGAKITACIADLPATGGTADARGLEGAQAISSNIFSGITKPVTVLFGDATYTLAVGVPTLNIPSNFSLIGAGPGRTTFILANNVTGTISRGFYLEGIGNVLLSGFTFDGNGANQATVTTGFGVQINNNNARVRLTNFEIKNTISQGVIGVGWNDVEVDHGKVSNYCILTNCPGVFAQLQSGAGQKFSIHHNFIDGTTSNGGGIGVHASSTSTAKEFDISHNEIIVGDRGATETLGIELYAIDSNVTSMRNWVVAGNRIIAENSTNTAMFGISIAGASDGVVKGNVIKDTRLFGIEVTGKNVVVADNVLTGSGVSTVDAQGTVSLVEGVTWTGNVFVDGADANNDMHVITGSTNVIQDVVISSNQFLRPQARAIHLQNGSGTIKRIQVHGNTIQGRGASSAVQAIVGSGTNGLDYSSISGNTISDYSHASGIGIDLDAGSDNNVVAMNSLINITTDYTDGGISNLIIDPDQANARLTFTNLGTIANCADSAGDAACAAAPAGSVVVDAADTNTVVSTTAVTANSQIFLQVDSSLGTRLSVTCNTQDPGTFDARVTARTAATSFTITLDAGPTTNPLCLSYFIVN